MRRRFLFRFANHKREVLGDLLFLHKVMLTNVLEEPASSSSVFNTYPTVDVEVGERKTEIDVRVVPEPSQPQVIPNLAAQELEHHASINVAKKNANCCGKLRSFSGVGFLIAVGYMDPGNWATDISDFNNARLVLGRFHLQQSLLVAKKCWWIIPDMGKSEVIAGRHWFSILNRQLTPKPIHSLQFTLRKVVILIFVSERLRVFLFFP